MTFKNEEKDKRSRVILFLVILALLIVNGWLIVSLFNKQNDNEALEEEKVVLTEDIDRLNRELDDISFELVEQKGKNQQLDSIINIKEQVIADQVRELRSALKRKDLSESQVRRLEAKIKDLNRMIMQYEYEVDSLSKLNKYLEDEVYAKDQEIKRQKAENEEIASDLNKANIQLDIAKRLEVQTIIGAAVKMKKNGEKAVSRLSRADKIKVEFTLDNNAVAYKERKTCYLQIIGPEKSTLHNTAKGSGTFDYNGEKSLYTAKQVFDFQNKNEKLAFYWDVSPGMTEGDYVAYAYVEGVRIGSTSFYLK